MLVGFWRFSIRKTTKDVEENWIGFNVKDMPTGRAVIRNLNSILEEFKFCRAISLDRFSFVEN